MRDRKKLLVELTKKILRTLRSRGRASRSRLTDAVLEGARVTSDEMKNIQRRVYDAVNVLEALKLVQKDSDVIRYCPEEIDTSAGGKGKKIEAKRRFLRENLTQYLLLQRLIERNQSANSSSHVHLPMVLVTSLNKVSVCESEHEVFLSSPSPLTLRNDTQLLTALHLDPVSLDSVPADLLTVLHSASNND